jgi:hypothetical protein
MVDASATGQISGLRSTAWRARLRRSIGTRQNGHDRAISRWVSSLEAVMAFGVVVIVAGVTTWAVYTRRRRLWVVFVLATIGVVSAEACGVLAYVVLLGATAQAPLVALAFAGLSIASFVGVARQPVRVS